MPSRRNDRTGGPVAIGELIGEIPLSHGRKVAHLTQNSARVLNASRRIEEGLRTGNYLEQLGYTTRVLAQSSLPYRNPGDELRVWRRVNGNLSISIIPDIEEIDGKDVVVGYPYGTMPRLIMIYLCSEAIATNKPVIELGRSVNGFLKAVGLGRGSGGKKGSYARFRDQMHRLLTCNITFRMQEKGTSKTLELMQKESIAHRRVLWWGDDERGPAKPTDAWVELNRSFFDEIQAHKVPLNLEAVGALKQSSLDLDIYTWLNHKVSYTNKPVRIPWVSLQKQLGCDIASSKRFKQCAKASLRKIYALWPELRIEDCTGGLRLKPCATHVPRTKML